jgi:O-antigen/teichoic acid export membrane protein
MGKRLKAFLSMGFASLVQVLMNIVRTKLIAVILGTAGVGITSLINNFITTITSFTNLGISNGIVREISKDKTNINYVKEVEITSYIVTLFLSLLSIIFIIIFSKSISLKFLNNIGYKNYIIISSLAIPFLTLNVINISIINGFSNITNLSKANIISSFINLVISVILIYLFKLTGAIYSIVSVAVVTSLIYYFYGLKTFRSDNFSKKISFKYFNISIMKPLFKYGITVIITSLMTNIGLLGVRYNIISNMGIQYNGIFQSVWAMCNQYMLLILSSLTIYYLPTLCSKDSFIDINNEINETLSLVMKLTIPAIILVLNFRFLLIRALYSNQFQLAITLVPIFLLGDLFKSIQWCLSMPFYSIPKLKMQILLEFIYDFILFIFSFVFINKIGLFGVGLGYIFSQIILVLIEYVYLNKVIKYKFSAENIKLLIVSIITILTCIVCTYLFNSMIGHSISALLFIFWSTICIKKEEILNAKIYVQKKFQEKIKKS